MVSVTWPPVPVFWYGRLVTFRLVSGHPCGATGEHRQRGSPISPQAGRFRRSQSLLCVGSIDQPRSFHGKLVRCNSGDLLLERPWGIRPLIRRACNRTGAPLSRRRSDSRWRGGRRSCEKCVSDSSLVVPTPAAHRQQPVAGRGLRKLVVLRSIRPNNLTLPTERDHRQGPWSCAQKHVLSRHGSKSI